MNFAAGVDIIAVLDEETDQYEAGEIISVTVRAGTKIHHVMPRDGSIAAEY